MEEVKCSVCGNLKEINFNEQRILALKEEKHSLTLARDMWASHNARLLKDIEEQERNLKELRRLSKQLRGKIYKDIALLSEKIKEVKNHDLLS